MRVIRKIGLLSLLLAAAVFVQNAPATIVLPVSSYAEAEDNWQGSKTYEEDGFSVLIDYAVYDTENLLRPGEIRLAEELDMPGQYIYAYQIFNHVGEPEDYEAVAYFAIFGFDELPLDVYVDSIDALNDSPDDPTREGIKPHSKYFNPSHTKGVWLFSEEEGYGYISAGEHSWFLVFSSDSAPVPGDYEIKGPEGDWPVPPEIPEPTMMTLLGTGAALMFMRRRKTV